MEKAVVDIADVNRFKKNLEAESNSSSKSRLLVLTANAKALVNTAAFYCSNDLRRIVFDSTKH